MAEIVLKNQAFDLTFHPSAPILYVGLLTGEVKAFSYSASKSEDEFEYSEKFSIRPTKRSCRGLATNLPGDRLYSVTKDKTFHEIDTSNGVVLQSITGAHESSINRVSLTMPNMLATGDDDGVVKLWDPRKKGEIRAYTRHFDYISDFLWLEDKKHLVATSGDGSLSVMDVRSNKTEPNAHSEDQEDELLSIVSIKGGSRTVVGTQSGILSVFNRSAGWGDSVDRIPGHPHSVDALYTLPSHLIPESSAAPAQAIIATGSSDGLVRLVQLYPTKVLGVVADHGDFPVERIKMDFPGGGEDGEGTRWLASVSHGERILMTDLKDVLEDSDGEDDGEGEGEADSDDDDEDNGEQALAADDDDEDSDDELPSKPHPKPSTTPLFGFSTTTTTSKTTVSTTTTAPKPLAPTPAPKSSLSALDSFSFSGALAQTSALVVETLAARSALLPNDDSSDIDVDDDVPPKNVPQVRKIAHSSDDDDEDEPPRKKKQSPIPNPPPVTATEERDVEADSKRKRKKRKKANKKGGGGVDGGGAFFADL